MLTRINAAKWHLCRMPSSLRPNLLRKLQIRSERYAKFSNICFVNHVKKKSILERDDGGGIRTDDTQISELELQTYCKLAEDSWIQFRKL